MYEWTPKGFGIMEMFHPCLDSWKLQKNIYVKIHKQRLQPPRKWLKLINNFVIKYQIGSEFINMDKLRKAHACS